MDYWSKPKIPREQMALFCPNLDAVIDEDHPVRFFDEILRHMDWSEWEGHYHGRLGQPPIHPRVIASVLLYGYSLGLRSSRKLEWACQNCLDVIWLAEGQTIDHSTLCEFRTKFKKPLKDLFRQIGRVAMTVGLVRLNQVGLDGTRVLANSSRRRTTCRAKLAEKLAGLDAQIEEMFAQAEVADGGDGDLFGRGSSSKLPRELADAERRREAVRKALASAIAKDAKRQKRVRSGGKTPAAAKVPVADPDSAVLPSKEGGHAPNYTPMAAVDSERGYIVDADVHAESVEDQTTVGTVDRIEERFGEKPGQLLADSGHGTGANLAQLQDRGVDAYIPVESPAADNPTERLDPTQPVPEADWVRLPRNRQKKLSRFAFVYDAERDCYWCPMGRKLAFDGLDRESRRDGPVRLRRYRCVSCEECPLSGTCRRGKGPRRVQHDEHEPHREAMRAKMNSPEGQAVYARRRWLCETPFGLIKSWMGLRQFLLRGLAKVGMEWCWACIAYNLRKLAADLRRLRAQFALAAS